MVGKWVNKLSSELRNFVYFHGGRIRLRNALWQRHSSAAWEYEVLVHAARRETFVEASFDLQLM
jgi:hypothetical protein